MDPRETLAPFAALIGEWEVEARHPGLGDVEIGGRASFEWGPGERFVVQRTEYRHPRLPDALSLIGAMERPVAEAEAADAALSMHCYDERGVHRVYGVSFDGRELRSWLDLPGFRQRMTARLGADGATLHGEGELDQGRGFEPDLSFTYRRAS